VRRKMLTVVLLGILEGKRILARSKCKWENNIEKDF